MLPQIGNEIGSANKRLRQVNRIAIDRDNRQMIAVADEVFGHRSQIAMDDPIAPNVPSLQMRGLDGEDPTFPLARRKPRPSMRGIGGRMRTPIHPDHPRRPPEGSVNGVADDVLRDRVCFFRNAQVRRTAKRISRRMRIALPLRHRYQIRVPTIRAQPQRVVHGDA